VNELRNHFEDLANEERSKGCSLDDAEAVARTRLGSNEALAAALLAKPGLRSLTARFPWAVFGLGPVAMIALSFVAALLVEVGFLESAHLWMPVFGLTPGPVAARWGTQVLLVWNTLAVCGAPLLLAWLFYWMGSRQRIPARWIVLGVALVCILGGFQTLSFYDTGCAACGQLTADSALIPPYAHFAERGVGIGQGLARAATNLAIAGGVWWFLLRARLRDAVA
jgi:hypothetical protein